MPFKKHSKKLMESISSSQKHHNGLMKPIKESTNIKNMQNFHELEKSH